MEKLIFITNLLCKSLVIKFLILIVNLFFVFKSVFFHQTFLGCQRCWLSLIFLVLIALIKIILKPDFFVRDLLIFKIA